MELNKKGLHSSKKIAILKKATHWMGDDIYVCWLISAIYKTQNLTTETIISTKCGERR